MCDWWALVAWMLQVCVHGENDGEDVCTEEEEELSAGWKLDELGANEGDLSDT